VVISGTLSVCVWQNGTIVSVCVWQNGTSDRVSQWSGNPGYIVRQPVRAGRVVANTAGVSYLLLTVHVSELR